jgi:hypothetical protein
MLCNLADAEWTRRAGLLQLCEARLNRSTYAQLAEIALAENADDEWRVASMGATFALVP